MLVEQLRQAWRARRAEAGLQAKLCFEADNLVLGAGTVLSKADAALDHLGKDASDQRLTTLLSVAYGPVAATGGLGHVRAAIARRQSRRWGRRRSAPGAVAPGSAAPPGGRLPPPVHGGRAYARRGVARSDMTRVLERTTALGMGCWRAF